MSFELDAGCRFTTVDETFATATGYDTDRLRGEHVSFVYPATDTDRIETIVQTLVETSGPRLAGETDESSTDDTTTDQQLHLPGATFELPLQFEGDDTVSCPHQVQLRELDDRTTRIVVRRHASTDGAASRPRQERRATAEQTTALAEQTLETAGEQELDDQREQLLVLNHAHRVLRDLIDAIVACGSRTELEQTTCDSLASTPCYEFAFTAAIDPSEQTVVQRVEAGVENYVESIPLSTDPDNNTGRGPFGRAVRTQEPQVSTDVFTDPDFEPWREDASARGYRAAAAVPITHDGALYGVLGVTSARQNAFTGHERTIIGQLGELLGHGIDALERKRVLLGETVIELELVIDNATAIFDGPAMIDQSVLFDRVVRLDDGRFLEYGTTAPETVPALRELVECVPHWDELTRLNESGDEVRFELAISSPPMFSVIDAHSGYVDSAALHDGDYTITIHVPIDTDIRAVTDAIRDCYPSARTVVRRELVPADPSIGQLQTQLAQQLTSCQRTALETAYYAGFFEWPRDSSGEAVAATLGISPATFHEHLRTAQKKLAEAILDDAPAMD